MLETIEMIMLHAVADKMNINSEALVVIRELLHDKAAALLASTTLPEDMVEAVMDKQVANMQPTPIPETRVYDQWAREPRRGHRGDDGGVSPRSRLS